jgi:hypothetical protein
VAGCCQGGGDQWRAGEGSSDAGQPGRLTGQVGSDRAAGISADGVVLRANLLVRLRVLYGAGQAGRFHHRAQILAVEARAAGQRGGGLSNLRVTVRPQGQLRVVDLGDPPVQRKAKPADGQGVTPP